MRTIEKRLIGGGVLVAVGLILHYAVDAPGWLQLVILGASYLIIGYDVLLKAARNIGHGNFLDENFLMSIATLGAFAIQMYPEAAAVMLFYQVGEWFEDRAVNRTRKSISDLMDIQPESARVIRDGRAETVDPEEVSVGETIEILAGEKTPLDGIVLDGCSSLDTKALTASAVSSAVPRPGPISTASYPSDSSRSMSTESGVSLFPGRGVIISTGLAVATMPATDSGTYSLTMSVPTRRDDRAAIIGAP